MDHRSRDYEEEARAAFLPRVPAGDDHPLADATPSVPSSSSARPAPRPSRPSAPPRSDDRVARSRDPLGASSDPLGAVPANRAEAWASSARNFMNLAATRGIKARAFGRHRACQHG